MSKSTNKNKKHFDNDTQAEEACKFDVGESMAKIVEKRHEREKRAIQRIIEQYDVDKLSDNEFRSLIQKESMKIREEDKAEDLRKKAALRRIKTLRTEEEIESAEQAGRRVLRQEVVPSEEIEVRDIHIRDKQTGEIIIKPYIYHNLPKDYTRYETVEIKSYYPYTFPSKTAAYLLPDDLEAGERVLLEDLIEDIVGESHAEGTYRLESAEAVWNGKKFEVDCESYNVLITLG